MAKWKHTQNNTNEYSVNIFSNTLNVWEEVHKPFNYFRLLVKYTST